MYCYELPQIGSVAMVISFHHSKDVTKKTIVVMAVMKQDAMVGIDWEFTFIWSKLFSIFEQNGFETVSSCFQVPVLIASPIPNTKIVYAKWDMIMMIIIMIMHVSAGKKINCTFAGFAMGRGAIVLLEARKCHMPSTMHFDFL